MKALYRIVNGLLAALVFPAALFLDFIFIQLSTSIANAGIKESISLKRVINILNGEDYLSSLVLNDNGNFKMPEALEPVQGRLIAFAVFFALVLVAALFIIVWSCVSNKHLPVFIASTAGIIFCIVMVSCFNSAAHMITSGEINIVKSVAGEGILSSILGGLLNIDTLMLGGFHNALLIIMIVITLWSVAFFLVDLGATDARKK